MDTLFLSFFLPFLLFLSTIKEKKEIIYSDDGDLLRFSLFPERTTSCRDQIPISATYI